MRYIDKSVKLKKELDSLRPLKKEDELRIMQKFRLDWNYHSNNLEGNTLTYGETKALILFGITAQSKPLKDHFEITGHDEAVKWILEIVEQERPLTENFIRELHKLILKEPYNKSAITPEGQPTEKKINVGVYKRTPNHVKTITGEIFRFASPEETPAMMNDLVNWYRTKIEDETINSILLAAEFHYRFIRIHPFDDGNGRTARILMNFILMKFGYPPVIIKTEDKNNYFAALRQADAGVLEPFIAYICENLNHSLEIMIRGAKGENIEDSDDLSKEIALLEQRLETVGQPIKISKSKEAVLKVYNDSIAGIISQFIEKARQFEKFYMENKFSAAVNGTIGHKTKEGAVESIRKQIDENSHSIRVKFEYRMFSRKGVQHHSHISELEFIFDNVSYRVQNTDRVFIEKLYEEQLEDNEIADLLNVELKKHKQFIESIIEEIKRK